MRHEQREPSFSVQLQWQDKLLEKFNAICIGKILRNCEWTVAIGCEDGVVRLYPLVTAGQCGHKLDIKNCKKLETKGGPIQCLLVDGITNVSGSDMVVSDSRGMLTLFSNQQILKRKNVSAHSMNYLLVDKCPTGRIEIVSSDSQGQIFAMSAYTDSWKLRLADIKQLKGLAVPPIVKCMMAVSLPNIHGHLTNYILASDNWRHLYVIHQGSVVMVLDTPDIITAMCSGSFIEPSGLEDSSSQDGNNSVNTLNQHQVALGSENGSVYIMDNYQIYHDEFANIDLTISHMIALASPDIQQTNTIVCAGHFNSLCVLHNGKLLGQHATPDWVNSLVQMDSNNDGRSQVIYSCLDNSIHAVKLAVT